MDHTVFPRTIEGPLTLAQLIDRLDAAKVVLDEWAAGEDIRRKETKSNKTAPKISATEVARAAQLAKQANDDASRLSGIYLTE